MLTTACLIMLSFAFHIDGFQYLVLDLVIFLGGIKCDNNKTCTAILESKEKLYLIYTYTNFVFTHEGKMVYKNF